MLLFHEALQSCRGFLLLTKKDSIDYPSGAVVLLRNGFESIVWGTSCLDDGEGTDLIDYIWNHQDMIMERDMAIYKKWRLPFSDENVSILEGARKRLDKKVSSINKFQIQGISLRKSYSN